MNWLWRQFLHAHIPSLSCVGLTYGIIPCQLFQCQALWLASLYTGALQLPDEAQLRADVEQQYAEVAAQPGGWPRHVHRMGNGQWDYNRMLASEALAGEVISPNNEQDFLCRNDGFCTENDELCSRRNSWSLCSGSTRMRRSIVPSAEPGRSGPAPGIYTETASTRWTGHREGGIAALVSKNDEFCVQKREIYVQKREILYSKMMNFAASL